MLSCLPNALCICVFVQSALVLCMDVGFSMSNSAPGEEPPFELAKKVTQKFVQRQVNCRNYCAFTNPINKQIVLGASTLKMPLSGFCRDQRWAGFGLVWHRLHKKPTGPGWPVPEHHSASWSYGAWLWASGGNRESDPSRESADWLYPFTGEFLISLSLLYQVFRVYLMALTWDSVLLAADIVTMNMQL